MTSYCTFFRSSFLLIATLAACGGVSDAEGPTDGTTDKGDEAKEALTVNTCAAGPVFTHVTTDANIRGSDRVIPPTTAKYMTVIDDVTTNGNPKALIIVTPNWTPNGGPEVPNYHAVGVWYDTETKRWVIYNEDAAEMPKGTGFNVRVANKFGSGTRSPAFPVPSPATTFQMATLPMTARLFVTANGNPGGTYPGANSFWPLAVKGIALPTSAWHLQTTDGNDFDANVAYNFTDLSCATVHTTTVGNITDGKDTMLAGSLAGEAKAVLFAMNRYEDGFYYSYGDPQFLAMRYDGGLKSWKVRSWSLYEERMIPGRKMNIAAQLPTR